MIDRHWKPRRVIEIRKAARWCGVFLTALLVCCGVAFAHRRAGATDRSPHQSENRTAQAASHEVAAEMHNVLFRFSDTAAAHIETLTGQLVPTGKNVMPVFDDKTSFDVRVTSAKIWVSPTALASILNTFVFAQPDAPLKGLSVAIEGDRLHIKGRLHSKGDIPFETIGSFRPTSDGKIRIHSEKIKAFRLPVKGIMNLFGIELAGVIDTRKVEGIATDKDDLILDMSKLLPAPHIQGSVTAVHIENNEILTVFGAANRTPPDEKGNFMAFKGNQLRFGKLTMDDADLTVLDLDPGDPLEWYQDRYLEQLVPGYSKITSTFGLRAYVKDYGKLSRGQKTQQKPAGN